MSGNPFGYGAPGYATRPANSQVRATLQSQQFDQMGGQGEIPWIRYPFFPTSPFQSTNPMVGHVVRYYSCELISTDSDYSTSVAANRIIRFDLPCRLIAINAGVNHTSGSAFPVGWDKLDTFSFLLSYANGERLHTASRLASCYAGTAQRPGELGATGWNIDGGASANLDILPHLAGLRIDIVLHCLELRGHASFEAAR